MGQTFSVFALGLIVLAAGTGESRAEGLFRPADAASSAVLTTNRVLRASLNRIADGSALWRDALAAVRLTNRIALVVTPEDLPTVLPGDGARAFDDDLLAEAVPLFDGDGVRAVVVIVNLPLLQRAHDIHGSVRHQFESDLDRILVHEIYGHGIPYLLAGDSTGRCADPLPGQRAVDACSIRRENAVRAELQLGVRTDSGLSSLAVARGLFFRGNH